MKPALLLTEVARARSLPVHPMRVLPALTGFSPAEPQKPHLRAWATNMPGLGQLHRYEDVACAGLHFTQSLQAMKRPLDAFLLLRVEGFGLPALEPRLVSRIGFGLHPRVSVLDRTSSLERLWVLIHRAEPGINPTCARGVRHVRRTLAAHVEWARATHITQAHDDGTTASAPSGTYIVELLNGSRGHGHTGRVTRVLQGPQPLRDGILHFEVPGVAELPWSVVLRVDEARTAAPTQSARHGCVTTHSPAESTHALCAHARTTPLVPRTPRAHGAVVDRPRTAPLAAASAQPTGSHDRA